MLVDGDERGVLLLSEDADFDYEDLRSEFENLERISINNQDPYFLSLYSGALYNVGNFTKAT